MNNQNLVLNKFGGRNIAGEKVCIVNPLSKHKVRIWLDLALALGVIDETPKTSKIAICDDSHF
ncbi:hypothetical protein I7103_002345 [Vibrio parahaemolyticus]|nr:hypothetical protein [Vibrio parahaemolyticus]TOD56216.1 hypothetical protein CGJ62_16060 [Vibrio parahaemolyticus]